MKLLGPQNIKAAASYRLMTFVVQCPVDNGLLLYHNMTKGMVLLSKEEQQRLEQSPQELPELISQWFLVPTNHDDCLLSRQFSGVARMLAAPSPHITSYTIMTTSDCNARCFYCYELGQVRRPMTEETALQVADYIIRHCGSEKVSIEWFGGEPLFNKPVIDLICNRLREAQVKFHSTIVSNGYLMDAATVKLAHDQWNLQEVQITIDGTEQTYNRVKAYIYKGVNAYQRVMENISHLMRADISVIIRMNMDMYNADDLERLTQELHERFGDSPQLRTYLNLLFGDKNKKAGICDDDKRKLLLKKQQLIEDKMRDWGLFRSHYYSPAVRITNCMADNDATVVIQPDGYMTKCEHYTDSHHVGHVSSDAFDTAQIQYFKEKGADVMDACAHCAKYPSCTFLLACPHLNGCYPEMPQQFDRAMRLEMQQIYKDYLQKEAENEIQG